MHKITPHLWFDKQAKEAAERYTAAFAPLGPSKVLRSSTIHDTPSGDADIVTIDLLGQRFMLISAGPYFKFTPAVSFLVACRTREEVNGLWAKLSDGGKALMELGEQPWSERYGWVQDRYGLSWQVTLAPEAAGQRITPALMFVGRQCGRAEEAMRFYASVFRRANVGDMLRYGSSEKPDKEGTVKYGTFEIEGMRFAAMDSARGHDFSFNEAVSFIVSCESQEEIDYYWGRLSADPAAEQCGWLKDKFTVSWQIVPTAMDRMLLSGDEAAVARVTQAFLKMKKFDVAALERASAGGR
jgi:predicted 3-demethylubiquinone-9 3-methyltransferase (glyoxalase superfamily)